jgi:glucosamine--fructose-6-phosphate aminotransferase (isomerizing)
MSHPYRSYFEITQQAEAWQECAEVITHQAESIRSFFDTMKPGEIIFTGCTSPYYIGKSAAAYWQSALGVPARAVTSSELIQFPTSFFSDDRDQPVLIAISRSGKTSETLWAVDAFQERFPRRVFHIGCAPEGPLAKKVESGILLPRGYEETLAQTSSFSAMFMAAQMVGALISGQRDVFQTLQTAPDIVNHLIETTEPAIESILRRRQYRAFVFLGSGPLYGVARDAALKMMEMSLSYTMSFPFLESRHGPRSVIDEGALVVGLYSHGGLGYEADVIEECTKHLKATTVAISPSSHWQTGKASYSIPVNCDWPDGILGLAYLPVIQLMAYYWAVSKGINPDLSRNLTPFIEIERA